MLSSKKILIAGLLMFVALVLVGPSSVTSAATSPEQPQGSEKTNSRGLEGTWRVQVTIRDCTSGAGLRTFPAFLTFAQGGTLTETTTGFPPALRSPGHGFWSHLTGHSYSAVSEAFLFSPSGVWTGRQRLTQSIDLDEQHLLNSTAINEVFDVNGNLLSSGCATAVATVME